MKRIVFSLAVAALAVAATTATATARIDVPPGPCDVEGTWAGVFSGQNPVDQGAVTFTIFNQRPMSDEGQGRAGAFDWTVVLTTNGSTASGHGVLVPPPTGERGGPLTVRFRIHGKGTNAIAGDFRLSAEGTV